MKNGRKQAVAYMRTSSASNVGADKDSERRQRESITAYAKANRISIVAEFYDAAVSGADAVDARPNFRKMLERCQADGISAVLVESASRFARDLAVQLTGHAMLHREGIELIPVDAPTFFTDPTPTAEMVRQILGAVSQFEKASLVAKLRHARDRIRAEQGRCEGRKPVPAEVIKEAKRLNRANRKTGKRRSLRNIAAELAVLGLNAPSGRAYHPNSVKRMVQT
jgi:DNA invertase Pin-like site-specific DNA recombinase